MKQINLKEVSWLKEIDGGIQLSVHVTPGAKKSRITDLNDYIFSISVDAPATESKANESLLEFLADLVHLRPSKLSILKGMKCRDKVVFIAGISIQDFQNQIYC